MYQENQNDLDAAICAYQNAYTMTPEDIDIYINLGSAFYDKEDFDNALSVYRKALELDPANAKIHCNLAFLHWGKGNTNEAIKEYELAIKYDDNYDIAYNNLGVIYLDDLGRVQKAIELFRKSAECNPNYAQGAMMYRQQLYDIVMPCGSISDGGLDPDAKSIF